MKARKRCFWGVITPPNGQLQHRAVIFDAAFSTYGWGGGGIQHRASANTLRRFRTVIISPAAREFSLAAMSQRGEFMKKPILLLLLLSVCLCVAYMLINPRSNEEKAFHEKLVLLRTSIVQGVTFADFSKQSIEIQTQYELDHHKFRDHASALLKYHISHGVDAIAATASIWRKSINCDHHADLLRCFDSLDTVVLRMGSGEELKQFFASHYITYPDEVAPLALNALSEPLDKIIQCTDEHIKD